MLPPILMAPAFRCGASTPWGGNSLRVLYGKQTPDEPTGESLEVSAIEGLNSTDENGEKLSALILRYGQAMTGEAVRGVFPLLLKLLDARDRLSVQVHPDDRYAAEKENKLGKTEAWVILQASPGAQLVYGVKAGTTSEQLRAASEHGAAVESLLRFVSVKAGDVFYIPSGMVHAIGAGIVLYEIQQSSDVTYRLYDWDRKDENGKRRDLHLDKAIDVTDVSLQLNKAEPKPLFAAACSKTLLLSEKYFCLERLRDCLGESLAQDKRRFSILTAVEDGIMICGGQTYEMPAGQTALLPAFRETVTLYGGEFLLARPAV